MTLILFSKFKYQCTDIQSLDKVLELFLICHYIILHVLFTFFYVL